MMGDSATKNVVQVLLSKTQFPSHLQKLVIILSNSEKEEGGKVLLSSI